MNVNAKRIMIVAVCVVVAGGAELLATKVLRAGAGSTSSWPAQAPRQDHAVSAAQEPVIAAPPVPNQPKNIVTDRAEARSEPIRPTLKQNTMIEEWLDEPERRLSRQETVLREAFGWRQGLIVGAIGLCAVSLVYLWLKVSRVAAKCGQLEEMLSPAEERTAPASAISRPPEITEQRPRVQAAALPAMRGGIPRVQVLSGVIDRLVAGINESRRRRGDVETGYALVGKIVGEGSSKTIIVSGLIDEGPNAARSGGHHKADRDHQQRELELLQLVDGDVMHIGDAHLHPGSMDNCSGGDYRTDIGNVRDSHSQEMVFVIATAASAHWGGRSAESLRRDGLNLNFFYLGKASGYEYRRFRPEVVQGEALAASVELRRFTEADPVRARLDFDNLRRLTAYRMTVGELPLDAQDGRLCVEMTHRTRGFRTMIAFSADPWQRPEVYVDTGSQLMQYQPAWLNGGWTGLVWFTPIVLEVEREMTNRHSAGAGKTSETSAGERSVPVEVRIADR